MKYLKIFKRAINEVFQNDLKVQPMKYFKIF